MLGWLKGLVLIFCALIAVEPAMAKVIVNAPAPATQNDLTTTSFSLYYAGGANATPTPGYIDSVAKFRYHQTTIAASTSPQNYILIDVQSDKTFALTGNEKIAVTLSITNSAGSEIKIIGAGAIPTGTDPVPADCSGGTSCLYAEAGPAFYSAIYPNTPNSKLRIATSVHNICSATGATGDLCASSAYNTLNADMLSQTLTVTFSKVNLDTNPTRGSVVNSTDTDPQAFSIFVSDIAPSVTCPTVDSDFYFPGDGQIYLKTGRFTSNANSGPPVEKYIFLGKIGSAPPVPPGGLAEPASDVVEYVNVGPAESVVKGARGFTNLTPYESIIHARNMAGMVSSEDAAQSCVQLFQIQSQPISGVLLESKCFIATAAYHNGRAAPVMMLRQFRDQVLAEFALGKKFIETYYRYSPAMAEWAWDKPLIRSLALKVLTPIEFAAWLWLKIANAAQIDLVEEAPTQPYIDRLKSQLPDKTAPLTTSYTEEQKKALERDGEEKPASSENYSEIEKQKIEQDKNSPDPNSHLNYSERLKANLPDERFKSSPSELVRNNKDQKLGYGAVPDIKNAISIRMGVSPGMKVLVTGASADNSFENIYGSGWQPELVIHYERQLFHSEDFGSFGLTGDFGFSYAEGFGLLQTAFAGTRVSQTKFSFIQLPILVGVNYRFNLLRFLRPYAGGSVGTMLYTEIRKDEQKDKRGYSFLYAMQAGVSFLMDFLDESTSRDSFLSEGIQHTYLFAEYFYLNSFSRDVIFQRSGIYTGFLFEF